MGKRLYVGNLPYSIDENNLTEKFSAHGTVESVKVITDRNTGRPRGFAFVEFTEQSAAAAAIEKFDGHELQGRNLRVSEAEERQRRAPSYSDGGGGGYGGGPPRGPKGAKPKGSRRNIRGKKRGF